MLVNRRISKYIVIYLGLSLASNVFASVDNSPKPGGVYKLKQGIYVGGSENCEAPSNKELRKYTGSGLDSIHSRACKVVVIARKANRYNIEQRCTESVGQSRRQGVERQVVIVRDALTFSQTLNGVSTTYNYCAPYQLPNSAKTAFQ